MSASNITRRKFIKVSATVAGAAGLGGLLQACFPAGQASPGASSSLSPAMSPSAGVEAVTLRVWHIWGGTREPLLEEVFRDFEKLHPNIRIEPRLTGFDVWTTEQLTAVASGDVPELSMGSGVQAPEFARSEALLPLRPFLERDGIDLDQILYPQEADITRFQGEPYILPMAANGGINILFYNKAMFEAAGLDPDQPPKTWTELEDTARKLTKRAGARIDENGISILGTRLLVNDFKHWLITNEAEWLSQDGKTVRFNEPNAVETLQWIVEFADSIYGGWENIAAVGTGQDEVAWTNLYSSKEAMHVSGPWMFGLVRDNAPDVYENLAFAPRPINKGNRVGGVIGDGVGVWLLKGNKHPDEAWELLKYITIGDGGAKFLKAQVRPSPLPTVNADPYFAEQNPGWDVVTAVQAAEVALPRTAVNSELDEIGEQMLQEALFHKKTPQEAIDVAAEQAQKALDTYWAG